MFGKLHDMAKSKRKPKEKAGRGRKLNPAGNERSCDHTFGYDGRRPESNKTMFSADGYSKDCYDELRDAIREGLAKQNLLPKSSKEEKAYFDRIKKFSEEKAYFDKTKHFTEEKGYLDRRKVVSEERSYFYRTKSDVSMEFPSTSSDQSSMFHSREFDTCDNSFQWSFEEKDKGPNVIAKLMDHPKSSSFKPQMHLGNERSVNYGRPILDMDLPKPKMPHFSLQKADSQRRPLEELIQTVQFKGLLTSPTPEHKKSLTDDSPHIVIIKPLHVTDSPEEHRDKQKYISLDLDTKEIIRKLKMKEVVPSRTKNVKKGALDMNELQRKLQGELSRLENVGHEKYYVDASTGTDDIATEKISSSKMKASVPAKPKVQIKEVIDDKGYKVQNLATNTRKPEEDQISHNTNKIASTSCSVLLDQTLQLSASTPTSLDCPSTRKKKAYPEKLESILASAPFVETHLKNVTVQSDTCYEHEQDLSETKLTTSKQVPAVDQINHASGNLDYWNKTESHLSDFASVIEQKSDAKTTNKSSDKKASNVTRNLLLGNPLFLNKVEELFYTNAYHQPCKTSSQDDNRMSDDNKLLLDCAKELLENKSLQSTRGAVHRFSHTLTNKTKNFIFLDQLVSEVCDGMDDLRSYKKLPGEKFAQDTLPKGLHKDLWCKGVVNGGWDLGWRSGSTPVEVEQIVVSIEHEVLNGIIEDILADMES